MNQRVIAHALITTKPSDGFQVEPVEKGKDQTCSSPQVNNNLPLDLQKVIMECNMLHHFWLNHLFFDTIIPSQIKVTVTHVNHIVAPSVLCKYFGNVEMKQQHQQFNTIYFRVDKGRDNSWQFWVYAERYMSFELKFKNSDNMSKWSLNNESYLFTSKCCLLINQISTYRNQMTNARNA